MARIPAPSRRVLWLCLGISLALHLLAVHLGLMSSIVALFGRVGEGVQDLAGTGMEVLRIASQEGSVPSPALPPDFAPDLTGSDLGAPLELRPGGLERGAEDTSGPGSGSEPGVRPPEPLTIPWLVYPASAVRDRISGVVRLRVLVGPDGRVRQAQVTGGLRPDCDEAVVEAAQRLVFRPAVQAGREVAAWVEYEVVFDPGRP